ncbi:MAG: hypothetical protein WAN68_21900 [Pseudolabrys sp.]
MNVVEPILFQARFGAAFPPDLHVDVVLTDTPETFANGRNAKVVIFAIFQ